MSCLKQGCQEQYEYGTVATRTHSTYFHSRRLGISTLAGAPFQARKANYLIGVFVCLLKLEGSR